MMMQSFEDWLIGVASVAAVAGVFGAHMLTTPLASEAIAAEPVVPAYSFVVTGKRKPAICKTEAGAKAAECRSTGETTVEITAR